MQAHIERCLICLGSASRSLTDNRDITDFNCPQCGGFRVTSEALQELISNRVNEHYARPRAEMSGWTNRNPGVLITSSAISDLFAIPVSALLDKADRLMTAVEGATAFLGEEIDVSTRRLLGVSSCVNQNELVSLLSFLRTKGWISIELPAPEGNLPDELQIRLNPDGLVERDYRHARRRRSDQGFVAMCPHESFDDAYIRGFQKAIQSAGYEPMRFVSAEPGELPDDRTIAEIRRSKFIVVDLTGQTEAIYFAGGLAAGLGITVIWTAREDARAQLPPGVLQSGCIFWDSPDILCDRLKGRIESLFGRGPRLI